MDLGCSLYDRTCLLPFKVALMPWQRTDVSIAATRAAPETAIADMFEDSVSDVFEDLCHPAYETAFLGRTRLACV